MELEAWAENIADLQAHFDRLQTRLEKGGHKMNISNLTNGGTTTRPPMRVGVRVQGGAPILQFAADTSTTVPIWPRGTGSQYASFVAAPVRFINVCEISNLAMEATEGKERGLVKVKRDELDKSLLAFENGVEAILNRDGSGTIDSIPSTATINNNTGTGVQTSSIVGLNTAASFVDQQTVQVLSAVGGTNRGSFTISYVDPVSQTIYSSGALPGGTATGDILVVQGATGAAGSSLYGKDYWLSNGNTGTIAGIPKANFPGRFSTPTINFNSTGTISNSTAQRIEAIRARALGDDYDEEEKAFWYTNYSQGVALSNQYYNVGFTRLDEGSDTVPDTAKKQMQKTWGGREVVYSSTAEATRMDLIVSDTFYFGELKPTRLHEWTPGITVVPVPANTGSAGDTYYDSQMFGYERGFQIICQDPKRNFYLSNLPVPTI